MKILWPLVLGTLLASSLWTSPQQDGLRTISERIWHLGDDPTPEWPEGPLEAEGGGLSVRFQGRAFEGEGTLLLRQRDVNNRWHIELNGSVMAELKLGGAELVEEHYAIPSGLIRDGENILRLVAQTPTDDILFGDLRYSELSLREYYQLRPIRLGISHVVEGHRIPLPARVTICDLEGNPVELFYPEGPGAAWRKGLVYTIGADVQLELPPGDYHVFASRGMEWSRAKADLHVAHDSLPEARYGVDLELTHEVSTPGFVAADTHIHTLTHSGHGDASVEERQATLAGEGVELAIATDHNHNTDYAPTQERMGLSAYYSSVVGNEVTTPIGHFNAFPLKLGDSLPPHDLQDLAQIIGGIRERGAKAIILNHPRWPDGERSPFATIGLDSRTGEWGAGWGRGFDALELVNSDTHAEDPLLLYRDWFALMNRGEAVVSVGASDSHAVGVVVGQGRTYVESAEEDPSRLDIEACSVNIAMGRSSVSMGIYASLEGLDGKSVMGDRLQASPQDPLPKGLRLRVAAPSWVQPERVIFFANGVRVHTIELQAAVDPAVELQPWELKPPEALDLAIPLVPGLKLPEHDYWLVAVVLGAGVEEPFWPLLNDYTLASTNPIFVDVDADGAFSSAKQIAEQRLSLSGTQPEAVLELLQGVDAAVAAQVMRLVRLDYQRQAQQRLDSLEQEALRLDADLAPWIGNQR